MSSVKAFKFLSIIKKFIVGNIDSTPDVCYNLNEDISL